VSIGPKQYKWGEELSMPPTIAISPKLDTLKDLTRQVQTVEGFHPLVAALKNGHGAVVDGAWGSSGALVAAALGLHAPKTLLIVIAHPGDVDGWADDIASFAGQRPTLFPAWDSLPGHDVAMDEVAGQRLRVLRQLESDHPPRTVVTTIQALLQPVPDRSQLTQRRRTLRAGDSVNPEELASWLVDHGFTRTDAVELPGEFSRRGGILDVFSAEAEAPYRLEFFGDEIESIRQFSAQTQRSLADLETVELLAISASGETSAITCPPIRGPCWPSPMTFRNRGGTTWNVSPMGEDCSRSRVPSSSCCAFPVFTYRLCPVRR
jgi:transcription-repair coupling factor (superfamily II helicase)